MAIAERNDIKNYLGIEGSNDDALLQSIVDNISSCIESYIDVSLSSTSHTEYHDGLGNDKLYTNAFPITSVSGIYQDACREWGDDTLIDPTTYFINNNYICLKSNYFYCYPTSIKVVYTAGYSSIPNDLKHVCIIESARVYNNRNIVGVSSKTFSETTTVFNMDAFLPQSVSILKHYKRSVAL